MLKFYRKSYRLRNWDYSIIGYYFVTLCTKNLQEYFGQILNGKMILNNIGQNANKFWIDIPQHFENVKLDEFVIMPNHVHGIIFIDKRRDVALQRPYKQIDNKHSHISPKSKSLSTIIRSYKSIVTKTINKKSPNPYFSWQPRFYDHIIRNERSLNHIRQYIKNNLLNWNLDENNNKNNKEIKYARKN